jgi:hypothetical protein
MTVTCDICHNQYDDGVRSERCMFCGKTLVEDEKNDCLKFTQIGDKEKPICGECFELRGIAQNQMSM